MQAADHYQSLGLSPDASSAAIKQAYRRLARQYHPDLSSAADAQQAMARLNDAYQVLSNRKLRSAYDRQREPAAQPATAEADFQPGFASFMQTETRSNHREERGTDAQATLAVDLCDAYNGAEREITVSILAPDGTGQRSLTQRNLQVQIPKGIVAGQKIRVTGQGNAGTGGAEAGDLLLEISFKPDETFQPEGTDVQASVALAPWEAAMGADIEVPTPVGAVMVSVPPDSPHGRRLRLKGLGIPAEPPGDLLLDLQLVLPPADDAKTRALYQVMARELGDFNPRETAPSASPPCSPA